MLNHSGPFCLPKDIFKKICGRFPTILRKRQALSDTPDALSEQIKPLSEKTKTFPKKNERPGVIQPQAFAKQKLNNFYPSAVNSRAKLFLTTVHIPGDTFRLKPSRKSI